MDKADHWPLPRHTDISCDQSQDSPAANANNQFTARQRREREFYEAFARGGAVPDVSFEPVTGKEKRPWNSYWFTYSLARHRYEQGDRKLLDFGCGIGTAAIRFAHVGYKVWGFDISDSNVEIAGQLAKKYNVESATHFSVQPAERLDYSDNQFDVVVGFNILHHVEIDSAIRETMRVLRPGGVAFFREHIEAPLFDTMRNSRLFVSLFPNDKSFDRHRHITEDERKLNRDDLAIAAAHCPDLDVRRFSVLSRLKRFTFRAGSPRPSYLEMVDYGMFAVMPLLRRFGGDAVLTLQKH